MPYGFITIDTRTESAPTEFIAGPFDVNLSEAEMIQDGATIEVVGDEVKVYLESEII